MQFVILNGMTIAILIGFKYRKEFKELPGIIVDLFHAYTFVKQIGAKIFIITDVMTDENVKLLKNVVFTGVVKADIISFISDIKENDEHIVYTGKDDFIRTITERVYNMRNVFVYYTGHGEAGHLLLPEQRLNADFGFGLSNISRAIVTSNKSNNRISMTDFRDIFIYNMDPSGMLLSIMDCCNGDSMGIPFILKDGDYRLIHRRQRVFTTQNIIHIVSTRSDEGSYINHSGSVFTGELFNKLTCGKRNLKGIVNDVTQKCLSTHPQTASLYVSHPTTYCFWSWLYREDARHINVEHDSNLKCVSIWIDEGICNECELNICINSNIGSSLI